MQRTTIAVSKTVKERLDTFGRKGMSYEQILTRLMDSVHRPRYLADLEDDVERPLPPVDPKSRSSFETKHWRGLGPARRLRVAERMMREGRALQDARNTGVRPSKRPAKER